MSKENDEQEFDDVEEEGNFIDQIAETFQENVVSEGAYLEKVKEEGKARVHDRIDKE
jgi:hypothetical protein